MVALFLYSRLTCQAIQLNWLLVPTKTLNLCFFWAHCATDGNISQTIANVTRNISTDEMCCEGVNDRLGTHIFCFLVK